MLFCLFAYLFISSPLNCFIVKKVDYIYFMISCIPYTITTHFYNLRRFVIVSLVVPINVACCFFEFIFYFISGIIAHNETVAFTVNNYRNYVAILLRLFSL